MTGEYCAFELAPYGTGNREVTYTSTMIIYSHKTCNIRRMGGRGRILGIALMEVPREKGEICPQEMKKLVKPAVAVNGTMHVISMV